MTQRVAVWSARRPWRTLAIWALAMVGAIGVSAGLLGSALAGDEEVTAATESRRADDLQREGLSQRVDGDDGVATEVVVVRSGEAAVHEPLFQRQVETVAAAVRRAGATKAVTYQAPALRRCSGLERSAPRSVARVWARAHK